MTDHLKSKVVLIKHCFDSGLFVCLFVVFRQRQADVNSLMLILALLCHLLPLLFQHSSPSSWASDQILVLSRASSIAMLVAYVVYIVFQLVTHRQLFESQEV